MVLQQAPGRAEAVPQLRLCGDGFSREGFEHPDAKSGALLKFWKRFALSSGEKSFFSRDRGGYPQNHTWPNPARRKLGRRKEHGKRSSGQSGVINNSSKELSDGVICNLPFRGESEMTARSRQSQDWSCSQKRPCPQQFILSGEMRRPALSSCLADGSYRECPMPQCPTAPGGD